jgi:uncharacterized protein (TIGR00297 family)
LTDPVFILLGFMVLGILSTLAWRLGMLDGGGSLAGFLVGYPVWLGGGPTWLAMLALVLILVVQTTRLGYATKRARGSAEPAHGTRGWRNVVANVGVAGLAGLGEFAYRDERFALFFAGALAAALSDTMATEVGGLSRSTPRRLTRPRQSVPPGSSGGVTGLGITAGVAGSGIISLAGLLLGVVGPAPRALLVVFLAGFLGCLVDSLLGDTIQGKYECQICGSRVESSTHCAAPCRWAGGVRWLGNNAVNALTTACGGLMAVLLDLLA